MVEFIMLLGQVIIAVVLIAILLVIIATIVAVIIGLIEGKKDDDDRPSDESENVF